MTRESCKLGLKEVLTILAMVAAIITSFFVSKAEGQKYTDDVAKEVRTEAAANINSVREDVADIKIKTAVIEEILVDRFGRPKK